jgi:hypothetical protein
MDRILKLVYSNWYEIDNKLRPFPNGLTEEFCEWASSHLKEMDTRYFFNDPTSTYYFRNSNFFYHSTIANIPMVSVNEIGEDGTYLFPIEIECNTVRYIIDTQPNYNFIETLSPKMLEHLRSGKVGILLVNMIDPSAEPGTIKEIERFFNRQGITKVIMMQGNIKEHNSSIQMLESIISLYQVANEMDKYPYPTALGYESDFVRIEDLNDLKQRTKKFICWNRYMNRSHRLGLCYLALKHNLLDDGFFSFLYSPEDNTRDLLSRLVDDDDVNRYAEKIDSLLPYQIDTHHLEYEELGRFFTVTNNKKSLYLDSYLHIVSETEFRPPGTPFMSEKTWRPILNLQPFIHVGNCLALNKIRELGFKTFHPFIDESYDLVINPKMRFKLIEREILKFNNLSLEEIHKWYYSIKDILIYNQNHLRSFKNFNPLKELCQI